MTAADRNGRDPAPTIAALDLAWERRARGDRTPTPALEPTLSATLDRLDALPDVPGPDSAFVTDLQRCLIPERPMIAVTASPPFSPRLRPAPPTPRPAAPHVRPAPEPRPTLFRRAADLAAVAALLAAVVGGTLFARGWIPGRDHGPAPLPALGDEAAPETNPASDSPTLRWTAKVGDGDGGYSSSPIIAHGLVFVSGYELAPTADGGAQDDSTVRIEDFLLAYDAATGDERWRLAAADLGGEQFGMPALSGDILVVTLSPPVDASQPQRETHSSPAAGAEPATSLVLAVDAATGRERWRTLPLADFDVQPPLLLDGTAYLQGLYGDTLALDAATGLLRWRVAYPSTNRDRAEPLNGVNLAAADGTLYVSGPALLRALEPASGAVRWQTSLPDQGWRDIAAGGGLVYLGTELVGDGQRLFGRIRALDAHDGRLRWEAAIDDINGSPTHLLYAAGLLLLREPTSGDPTFVALDAATGVERWRTTFDGYIPGPLTWADGVVYFVNERQGLFNLGYDLLGATSYLYAFDAASGRQRWRIEPDTPGSGSLSSPSISGEHLVVHQYDDYDSGDHADTLSSYTLPPAPPP